MFKQTTLMLLMLLCMAITAACQSPPTASETPILAPTLTPGPTRSAEPTTIESTLNGVEVSVEVPAGWEWRKTDEGLLVAERIPSMEWGSTLLGVQAYFFVRALNEFEIAEGEEHNIAWVVLKQIIEMPKYIGKSSVSEPYGFTWDGHDAAYYLLNNGNGNVTILMAITLHTDGKLVICNVSSPSNKADSIRVSLPHLLGSLSIDGVRMNAEAVNTLPDPLDFPPPPHSP
ncbi:MAG: hypothetical protein K8L97_11155 [Anaerolineae bacterium]|nr:hypothetical protein [Anaerolineae bacterium]